jgi:type 1 glutamine amidotransferase
VLASSSCHRDGPLVEESSPLPTDEWLELFNGKDLTGWYTWTQSHGRNNSPPGYFRLHDGQIHLLDIESVGSPEPFGYLATDTEYSDYHLRFEYKWGKKKFAPRESAKRDSGLLYHMSGPDRIWPTSLEYQVQEGDTGDLFLLHGPQVIANTTKEKQYLPSGTQSASSGRIVKSSTEDKLEGWNRCEVIVRGASFVHVVNGVVVNRGFQANQFGQPITTGKIAFQLEGAEVFFRNIELKRLPPTPRLLIFSKTSGYRHPAIEPAINAIEKLASTHDFEVESTEDAKRFNDVDLARFDAVCFLMTTGDVLNADEQQAFEHFIHSGGGFCGVHSASDTEYDWPWYGELVGAYFQDHPRVQTARIQVEEDSHPSTAHLNETWTKTDEWYNFRSPPPESATVLLRLDESSYKGGTMGEHPIAWFRAFDGGRSFYTGLGHTPESYQDPTFLGHLLGGLQYALDLNR